MEDLNATILPYVLENLSRKRDFSDTLENLSDELEERLLREKNLKLNDLKGVIQRACLVGQNLGIMTMYHDSIRMPFNIRGTARRNNWIYENEMTSNSQNPVQSPPTAKDLNKNNIDPKVSSFLDENMDGSNNNITHETLAKRRAVRPGTKLARSAKNRSRRPKVKRRRNTRSNKRRYTTRARN